MAKSETVQEQVVNGQMTFLDHLDELRKRLVNSVVIITLAFIACWFVSDRIYNFLSIPIRQALSEASRKNIEVTGINGSEQVLPISELKEGDSGRYLFDQATKLGSAVVGPGTTVDATVKRDGDGKLGLFSTENILTNNSIVLAGIKLPLLFDESAIGRPNADERMVVTTAQEQFTLYVTVSLYAAIAISIPLLLFQIWMFVSPALYKHERSYVTPFVALSTVAFVFGAAFAYYILFPPAASYMLGIGGGEFQLLLRATDYFDLIIVIMLAMGIIFQMPAVTYVLARIGVVSAALLIRSWKISIVVILIVAAVVSPTGDIPNLLLFAAPMVALYIVSIFIAWFFGKQRMADADIV